jgi:hypothetical protein
MEMRMFPIPKLELTAASLKLIVSIACALALALLVHDRNRWKAKTTHYAELLSAERGAHAATLANVRAASEQARKADQANVERVTAWQSAINQRSDHDFEERLADARIAASRLRDEQSPGPAGAGRRRAAPLPGLPAGAESVVEAAGQNRLSVTDKLIATEQAIQLDELIKWVKAQGAVDNQGRGGSIPGADDR